MGENGRIDGRPCQRLHLVFKLEGLEIGIKPERRRQIRKEFWASQSQRNQSSLINELCTFEEGIVSDFSVHSLRRVTVESLDGVEDWCSHWERNSKR
jgi:hypothetical protein